MKFREMNIDPLTAPTQPTEDLNDALFDSEIFDSKLYETARFYQVVSSEQFLLSCFRVVSFEFFSGCFRILLLLLSKCFRVSFFFNLFFWLFLSSCIHNSIIEHHSGFYLPGSHWYARRVGASQLFIRQLTEFLPLLICFVYIYIYIKSCNEAF